MATRSAARRKPAERLAIGRATPRSVPPRPARSLVTEFDAECACIGISPFPWQDTVGRYLYGLARYQRWLYPEVATIVARQNGKTEILVPHITRRLLMGRRIMHTAQNRELPREVFGRVADHIQSKHGELLLKRPRFANGQEEIRLRNGGHYRIVAPTRGGARGPSNDDLVIDEVREMDDHDFMAAAKPTLNASANPQTLYLSNAGDEDSVVLNALRKRAGEDRSLAYLEWSAAPERKADDVAGWQESNPSMGHMPQIEGNLVREHRAHRLAGTIAIFETEHLCRWVLSMRERLVDEFAWAECEQPTGPARRPFMAVSMDPKGRRASAALAWRIDAQHVGLELLLEAEGDPVIDVDRLNADLRAEASRRGVPEVGYDPLTDAGLARGFRKVRKIAGAEFANASARFATGVQARALRWQNAGAVTEDLVWTTRKAHDESGSFQAVRADDDRPITAALASIRAVWMASGQPSAGVPRIY